MSLNTIVLSTESNDCSVDSVTIYKDRAEVVRKIRFLKPQANGEYKVEISSITDKANPDTFRVRGTSQCEVVEVSHSRITVKPPPQKDAENTSGTYSNEDRNQKVKDVEVKLKAIEKSLKVSNQALLRLKDQRKFFNVYANNSLSTQQQHGGGLGCGIDEAKSILQYHSELTEKIDLEEIELNESIDSFHAESRALRTVLKNLTDIDRGVVFEPYRTVSIIVNVKNGSPATADEYVQLSISYIVSDASWTSSYDIRVNMNTATSADTSESMILVYYAEVVQKSGEDWNDCCLFLSTSNPAEGSAPPVLPNLTVDFVRPVYSSSSSYYRKGGRRGNMDDEDSFIESSRGSFALMSDGIESSSHHQTFHAAPPPATSSAGLAGTGDAGSTIFVVNRHVTIPADGKPHKVMVTTSSFIPQLVHYLAPSVSTTAYLQAKAKNISQYPLLSSSQVSIFLDGSFACTSQLKQTNPGESFTIYLGADPAFKTEYLPCRTSVASNWLSSTKTKTYTYTTILHNTKRSIHRVIIAEVLPSSQSSSSIKVDLIEPAKSALSKPSEGFTSMANVQDAFQAVEIAPASTTSASSTTTTTTTTSTSKAGKEKPVGKVSTDTSIEDKDGWPKDSIVFNENTHSIVWLRTLPPNSKVELKFQYSITYPQGKDIEVLSN